MYTIVQPGKVKVGGRDRWPHTNSFPYLRGARDSADYLKQVRFQLDARVIFLCYKDN